MLYKISIKHDLENTIKKCKCLWNKSPVLRNWTSISYFQIDPDETNLIKIKLNKMFFNSQKKLEKYLFSIVYVHEILSVVFDYYRFLIYSTYWIFW